VLKPPGSGRRVIRIPHSQEATLFSEGSVKAAQRSVEISLVQYKEGAVDYQRVLDAQRSLLQEQNSLA